MSKNEALPNTMVSNGGHGVVTAINGGGGIGPLPWKLLDGERLVIPDAGKLTFFDHNHSFHTLKMKISPQKITPRPS